LLNDKGSHTSRIMLCDLKGNRTNRAVIQRRSSEQIDTVISDQEAEAFVEDESDPKNDVGKSSNSNVNVSEDFDDESDLDDDDDDENDEDDDLQVHQQLDSSLDDLDEELQFSHCVGRPDAFLNSKFVRNLLDLENHSTPSLFSSRSIVLSSPKEAAPRLLLPTKTPKVPLDRSRLYRASALKNVVIRKEAIEQGAYNHALRVPTPSSTSSNSIPGKNKKKKRAPRERSPPKASAPRSTAREVVIACFTPLESDSLMKEKNQGSSSSNGLKLFSVFHKPKEKKKNSLF
jgi:hypothetical protein